MDEQEIPGDAAHERVLSIVVPCYNEEESIPLFYRETRKAANELRQRPRVQVEYVFVDDGSTDSTLDILKKLRAQDKQVHYVSFSRNFGKESALYAGLRAANGDFVATLDADLQDPPSLLPQMIEFLDGHADYDCVATRRETRRGEPIVRSFFARMFYRIINHGNTQRIAERIHAAIGGDIARIDTVEPYTGDYDDVVAQGEREVKQGYLPPLKPMDIDLDRYDTIVLGTPVWWYTCSPAMRAFLTAHDLSGKTVYPFATNGGWLGRSIRDMRALCPGAAFRPGLDVHFDDTTQRTPDADVNRWIAAIHD